MRCPHCPRMDGECPGEQTVRLCELVDPSNASYNPSYLSVISRGVVSPPVYPPVHTMISNAVVALADAIKSGFKPVSPKEREIRLAICTGTAETPKCVEYDDGQRRCMKCGCIASLKVRLDGWHCPLGKW
jgi:hypothetical protein